MSDACHCGAGEAGILAVLSADQDAVVFQAAVLVTGNTDVAV